MNELLNGGLMSDHPRALGGTCSARFDPLRELFAAELESGEDLGASLAFNMDIQGHPQFPLATGQTTPSSVRLTIMTLDGSRSGRAMSSRGSGQRCPYPLALVRERCSRRAESRSETKSPLLPRADTFKNHVAPFQALISTRDAPGETVIAGACQVGQNRDGGE